MIGRDLTFWAGIHR